MRYFQSATSYTDDEDDSGFGWEIGNVESANKTSELDEATVQSIKNSATCSGFHVISCNISLKDEFFVEKYAPCIKIYSANSVEETQMKVERCVNPNSDLPARDVAYSVHHYDGKPRTLNRQYKNILKSEIIDSFVPDNILSLIKPDNYKSILLLSVIHYSKYESLQFDASVNSDIKSRTLSRVHSTPAPSGIRTLKRYHSINNYLEFENQTTDNVSLVEEFLSSNQSHLHKSTEEVHKGCVNPLCCIKFGTPINNSKVQYNAQQSKCFYAHQHSMAAAKVFESVKPLYGKIRNLRHTIAEMRDETGRVRRDFQEQDMKVRRLLKEAEKVNQALKETTYLDDLLNMLNGKLEKIKLIKLPFRICSQKPELETNLII